MSLVFIGDLIHSYIIKVGRYNARQCTRHNIITSRGPGSVMVGKDKRIPASHHATATTFLMTGIIATGILFVFTLVLNQNHTAMAQQPTLEGTYKL
jgi:hypothetical protein